MANFFAEAMMDGKLNEERLCGITSLCYCLAGPFFIMPWTFFCVTDKISGTCILGHIFIIIIIKILVFRLTNGKY